jgi:hypothetical protein
LQTNDVKSFSFTEEQLEYVKPFIFEKLLLELGMSESGPGSFATIDKRYRVSFHRFDANPSFIYEIPKTKVEQSEYSEKVKTLIKYAGEIVG